MSSVSDDRSRGVLPAWAIQEIDRLRGERDAAYETGYAECRGRLDEALDERDQARADAECARQLLAYHGFEATVGEDES